MRKNIDELLEDPELARSNDIGRGRQQQRKAVQLGYATIFLAITGIQIGVHLIVVLGAATWTVGITILLVGHYNERKGWEDFDTTIRYFKMTAYRERGTDYEPILEMLAELVKLDVRAWQHRLQRLFS